MTDEERRAKLLEKYGTDDPARLRAGLADLADVKAAEMLRPAPPMPASRPAEAGELCTCGRPAVEVFPRPAEFGGGETGYCGVPDGGNQTGPCVFCGGPRHFKPWGDPDVCPKYRLRLETAS